MIENIYKKTTVNREKLQEILNFPCKIRKDVLSTPFQHCPESPSYGSKKTKGNIRYKDWGERKKMVTDDMIIMM